MKLSMKPTRRRPSGFTLVEMMTSVGIITILSILAYGALALLPQRIRLTSGAMEFSAVISAARSHAYGRNQRVVVLFNGSSFASNNAIQYWVVVDGWSNMQNTLKANPSWVSLKDLLPGAPAPSGSNYLVFDNGRFNAAVRVRPDGFKFAVGSVLAKGCGSAMMDRIGLAEGATAGSGSYPPPYCFVPSDKACTFCAETGADAKNVRGAIFFEPDGSVDFYDAEGVRSPEGSASITLTPARDADPKGIQSVVITNTGLVRTFSASR